MPQDPNDETAEKLLQRILAERRKQWQEQEWAKLVQKAQKKVAQNGRKSQNLPARLSDLQPAEWQDIPEADYARYLPKNDKWKEKYKEPVGVDTAVLPTLPEGWVWATVSAISKKVVDGVHKKPNYVEEGVPFVTVKNLTAGPGIEFDNLNYITTHDHHEFSKRTNPEKGDILISKDGTLGVVRLVETDREFNIFVSVALVKPIDIGLSSYLEYAFSSPQVQRQMVPKGSGLQHIHLEDLRADCVPIPPLSEQGRIVKELKKQLSIIAANEKAIAADLARAERLRQSILQQAFSGLLVPQENQTTNTL